MIKDDKFFNTLTLEEKKEFLTNKASSFFETQREELDSIRKLLEIKLNKIALGYTLHNNIQRESVIITTRTKTLKSFLRKLDKNNWKHFYDPAEIATDIIGARISCWFINDCYGVLDLLKNTSDLNVERNSIEDYNKCPKPSGYRAIHLLNNVTYDKIKKDSRDMEFLKNEMTCEIQVRTKLQDVFGDITHDFHNKKEKDHSFDNDDITKLLNRQAHRFDLEDRSLMMIRDHYIKENLSDKNKKHLIEISNSI